MSISMGQLAAKFQAASEQVGPGAEKAVATIAQLGVGYVKEEIQEVHAVDTGTMLNSTQAEKLTATTWAVGPTVHYAPYVALGTSRMAARPFHIMAARRLSKDIPGLVKDLGLNL